MVQKVRKIRIAIISPPFISLVCQKQRGTERIVYELAEELSKRNHKVTVFGAGEYKGLSSFVQVFKNPLSEREKNLFCESSRLLRIEIAYLLKTITEIIKRKREFDIILNHARGGYIFLPFSQEIKIPIINVLHLPIFKELGEVLALYKKPNIITLSNSQRKNFPNINYLATIYNGVDLKEFKFCSHPQNYFLYLGTLGEHKNPKEAILAAIKARVNLIIAGGKKREPYFSKEITPLLKNKRIKYLGEVSDKKRIELLRRAKALLFPIKWQEPFGLVMIEAMACGTPVIAYPNGAVPEVVKNKKTGFLVKNIKEMTQAIRKIDLIKREKCRERVEKNFGMEKMIDNYEKIIRRLVK